VAKKRSSAAAAAPPASRPRNTVAAARGTGERRKSGSSPRNPDAVREFVKSVAVMIFIFLFFRTFLVEAFRIPSGSMIPTLLVGDWLFVNKLVYGPHVPFTQTNLPGYSDPKRGEVVVFESPYQADEAARGLDPQPTLVKRLVAVEGDTAYMRAGQLFVNGVVQRQPFASAEPAGDGSEPGEVSELFDWQRGFALRSSRFGPTPVQPTHDDWGPLVIPARHYMMLGDNRYNSKDSRYWGLVPRANIRGRPLFVYYSYDTKAGTPWLRGLTEVRWGRIGHRIR
jgi:signal peptidase I